MSSSEKIFGYFDGGTILIKFENNGRVTYTGYDGEDTHIKHDLMIIIPFLKGEMGNWQSETFWKLEDEDLPLSIKNYILEVEL
jgi:hypothetical protein